MIDEKLLSIIKSRRSIRKFNLEKKVEDAKLEYILEAANWAPSACNGQAWHFVVVDEKELLHNLYDMGIKKVKNTPVCIFVFYRKYLNNKHINFDLDDHIQSGSASVQNMLLAAHNIGLGAVWINGVDININKLLDIPFGYEFIAMVRIGYPYKKNTNLQKRKFKLEEISSKNKFNFPNQSEIPNKSSILFNIIYVFLSRIKFIKFINKIPFIIKIKSILRRNKDVSSFKHN